jgi:DNA-directed RNA polymerase subunit H (RpoH/RPB5)
MHVLQPKHTKLSEKEAQELLERLNLAKVQLPKILLTDPSLPEGCAIGDIIKVDREDGLYPYFRVVI